MGDLTEFVLNVLTLSPIQEEKVASSLKSTSFFSTINYKCKENDVFFFPSNRFGIFVFPIRKEIVGM